MRSCIFYNCSYKYQHMKIYNRIMKDLNIKKLVSKTCLQNREILLHESIKGIQTFQSHKRRSKNFYGLTFQVFGEIFIKVVTSEVVGFFPLFLKRFSRATRTIHQTHFEKLELYSQDRRKSEIERTKYLSQNTFLSVRAS